ncbi:MAG: VWA domain-containing protein [Rhodocyclaceae bacterium]|nr:VWA domain-containing protein [Rhodocyclaceae bacterium]
MEEFVGGLWHRFITRQASRRHPEAAVRLDDVERLAGTLFRALGGDAGLRVAAASESTNAGRRRWLSRVAGTEDRVTHASRDQETLRLPPEIDLFAEQARNRDLYLWLIAQAATAPVDDDDWLLANQRATRDVLARYPGFAPRYRRLVAATLELRLPPERLPADEAATEQALRRALEAPGTVAALPSARRPPQPVPLWLYPCREVFDHRSHPRSATAPQGGAGESQDGRQRRRSARREDDPDGRDGFILPFRAESLLSWADYVKVNRALDDDPNDEAVKAADDMEELAISDGTGETASTVRFDLDLPSAAVDDVPLASGILLPEWHWKQRRLLKDQCSLVVLEPRDATPCPVPARLNRASQRIRNQFEALTPSRRWLKAQPDGSEADLDACVRAWTDRRSGRRHGEARQYLKCERRERDLACLVLADLSLSTDAHVSDDLRVIDVIRDSLMLLAEALSATGDRFGLYGFSSLKRDHVRFHRIKDFAERHGAVSRGRIAALKPGYYTRMGAGIRQSTRLLADQPNALRLMMILTDGKPNDMDHYEGRFGIEDTRMAVLEARQQGVRPFCVTIDHEGADYLPHVFGVDGFTVIRKPEELPTRLPMLYASLVA